MTGWQTLWMLVAFFLIMIETNLSYRKAGWDYFKWSWLWLVAGLLIWRGVAA